MKKMLLGIGVAAALAITPVALVSAQGFSHMYGSGSGDQVRLHTQEQTQLVVQDQTRLATQDQTRLRLHDGTGENCDCDGPVGDAHQYGGQR